MKNYNKQDFYKNGFYVIRNLLNEDEIKKYISCIKNKRDSLLKQNAASIDENGSFKIKTSDTGKFKNYSEYDDENLWDYVSNKKLLDNIDSLLNEKIGNMEYLQKQKEKKENEDNIQRAYELAREEEIMRNIKNNMASTLHRLK